MHFKVIFRLPAFSQDKILELGFVSVVTKCSCLFACVVLGAPVTRSHLFA